MKTHKLGMIFAKFYSKISKVCSEISVLKADLYCVKTHLVSENTHTEDVKMGKKRFIALGLLTVLLMFFVMVLVKVVPTL